MSTDLLAARVKAVRARMLETAGQPRRHTAPEAPQTPGNALTARARAVQGHLLAAYQNRRGNKVPDGSGSPEPQFGGGEGAVPAAPSR